MGIKVVYPDKDGNLPDPHITPLSDYTISMIHAGLEIPNPDTIIEMAREIRMYRGVKNPELI